MKNSASDRLGRFETKCKPGNVIWAIILVVLLIAVTACQQAQKSLVVYTSVDRVHSEPIFESFEDATGIKVLAVYDVEANKTTGLYHRLLAEKDAPKADVFWNGEIMYTMKLAQAEIFQPYRSPEANGLPDSFLDPEGLWTAFGGRARVFIVNKNLLTEADYPESLRDILEDDIDHDMKAMAKPLFGTTSTHMASLYSKWGETLAYDFFKRIAESDIRIVDGNGAVRDLVASGQLAYGLTDTDDALGALERGAEVDIVFPDQGQGNDGTLVIPNSIGVIKGAQNRDEAQQFVDYMLSEATMEAMMASNWCQVSAREINGDYPLDTEGILWMAVDFQEIEAISYIVIEELTELFNR